MQNNVEIDFSENINIEYYNQVVYYYSGNNLLIAVNADNGSKLWKATVINPSWIKGITDELIYLPSEGKTSYPPSYFYAIETKTGKQAWELSFDQTFSPRIDIIGDKIYILTREPQGIIPDYIELRRLIVRDKTTSDLLWQFNDDYSYGEIDFAVDCNVVYVSTKGGALFALDNQNGEVIWHIKTTGSPNFLQAEENTLIVGYEEKYISAFDTKTGSQLWILEANMDIPWFDEKPILFDDGVIYAADASNQKINAIDIETGNKLWSWRQYHPYVRGYSLVSLDDNFIYVDQHGPFLGQSWFFALKTTP